MLTKKVFLTELTDESKHSLCIVHCAYCAMMQLAATHISPFYPPRLPRAARDCRTDASMFVRATNECPRRFHNHRTPCPICSFSRSIPISRLITKFRVS